MTSIVDAMKKLFFESEKEEEATGFKDHLAVNGMGLSSYLAGLFTIKLGVLMPIGVIAYTYVVQYTVGSFSGLDLCKLFHVFFENVLI